MYGPMEKLILQRRVATTFGLAAFDGIFWFRLEDYYCRGCKQWIVIPGGQYTLAYMTSITWGKTNLAWLISPHISHCQNCTYQDKDLSVFLSSTAFMHPYVAKSQEHKYDS